MLKIKKKQLELPPGGHMPPRGMQFLDSEHTVVGQEEGLGWFL